MRKQNGAQWWCVLALAASISTAGCDDFLTKNISIGVADSGAASTTTSSSSSSTSSGDSGTSSSSSGGSTVEPIDDDADGLSNEVESLFVIEPRIADSDHDGFADGLDFVMDTGDPLDATETPIPVSRERFVIDEDVVGNDPDGDLDGLGDLFERENGLNPDSPDTDRDGYEDGLELLARSDPFRADSRPTRSTAPVSDGIARTGSGPLDTDSDGLADSVEPLGGTRIDDADTDNDGFSDAIEYLSGSDGLDQQSVPEFAIPDPPAGLTF